MFRISEKVPEVYMKESRDFQILPRIDDLLFLGEHYDISTTQELNNPKKCRNSCLKYLAEKVGFYTDKYIPDNVLINIISAFRTALKNKGTDLGIQQAVIAILKAENSIDPPRIVYTRGSSSLPYYEQYTINIYTPIKIINEVALREFLKYIIPAGYNYNIYAYDSSGTEGEATRINTVGQLGFLTTSFGVLGGIRGNLIYDKENVKATVNYSPEGSSLNTFIDGYSIWKDEKDHSKGFTNPSKLEDRLIGTSDLGVVVGGDSLPYTYDNNGVKYKDNNINIKVKTEQEESNG